jgi:hypothetical protein
MECDFNLLCYGLLKIPEIIIILKVFKHLKIISSDIYFIYFIASWFEFGNGKKCYFQYHLNIHILS